MKSKRSIDENCHSSKLSPQPLVGVKIKLYYPPYQSTNLLKNLLIVQISEET
ncbi:hypothetical protein E1A91_D05G421200v1 [Gossypium mustelinum]|uniref:Uncharacterized protein n=1 Tax=Gossypium mustelinum TaxID=34275 RepID=A0A5D2V760_GOSMU|nr:hypothetical protein E1A91_D05G421200v1 [Gossypium mustelinum]